MVTSGRGRRSACPNGPTTPRARRAFIRRATETRCPGSGCPHRAWWCWLASCCFSSSDITARQAFSSFACAVASCHGCHERACRGACADHLCPSLISLKIRLMVHSNPRHRSGFHNANPVPYLLRAQPCHLEFVIGLIAPGGSAGGRGCARTAAARQQPRSARETCPTECPTHRPAFPETRGPPGRAPTLPTIRSTHRTR